MTSTPDVVIVGGGPAGLSCAIALRHIQGLDVVVVEREREAGGIPRHTDHLGFGMRDLHRILRGPAYARRLTELAIRVGVDLRTETTATDITPTNRITVTAPSGRTTLSPRSIVLATGCRERPGSARLLAGNRPDGVITTGTLQQLVRAGRIGQLGRCALVIGAEHVSFSAVQTLAEAGIRTTAMITEHPVHQTVPLLRLATAGIRRIPLLTSTRVDRIIGADRVQAVEVHSEQFGRRRLNVDLIVCTADWIPDHELARDRQLRMDTGTRGPVVDGAARTSAPGVFAIGNMVHAAESSGTAAVHGRHAATHVAAHLRSLRTSHAIGDDRTWMELELRDPLAWIHPSVLAFTASTAPVAPPLGRFLLRVHTPVRHATITVSQGDSTLHVRRVGLTVPGRPVHLDANRWLASVDVDGPKLQIALRGEPVTAGAPAPRHAIP